MLSGCLMFCGLSRMRPLRVPCITVRLNDCVVVVVVQRGNRRKSVTAHVKSTTFPVSELIHTKCSCLWAPSMTAGSHSVRFLQPHRRTGQRLDISCRAANRMSERTLNRTPVSLWGRAFGISHKWATCGRLYVIRRLYNGESIREF